MILDEFRDTDLITVTTTGRHPGDDRGLFPGSEMRKRRRGKFYGQEKTACYYGTR